MKKTIVTLLLMVFLMTMMVIPSNAADSFGIKITPSKQEIKRGESVTLVVAIENANIGEDGYVSAQGLIEFDTNVFEAITKKKIEALVDWDSVLEYNADSGKFAMVGQEEVKTNKNIFQITFTAKSTAAFGNSTITLKDMQYGSKNTKVQPANASATIKIVADSTEPEPTDTTPPTVNVTYSDVTGGKQVTITSSEPLQEVSGWQISADRKTLTKVYTEAFSGKIPVLDEAGNRSEATVNVEIPKTVVDVTKPTGKLTTTKNANGSVTAKIEASEAVQPVAGWEISVDKKVLTKTYTESKKETVILTDLAGNKSESIAVNIDVTTATGTPTGTQTGTNSTDTSRSSSGTSRSGTDTANSSIPKAGIETSLITLIAVVAISGAVAFFKYRGMKY